MFANQNLQGAIFLLGMILVGISIIVHGLVIRPGKIEIAIWLGLAAVYTTLFLRLGLPERSHLIEYSVLAIIIHKALCERRSQGAAVPLPGMIAFAASVLIGVLDECIQLFLPDRVFDTVDMIFNALAAFMAVGTSSVLQWARKMFGKPS